MRLSYRFTLFLFLGILVCIQSQAQAVGSVFSQLRFRFIGPDGNRAIAVAGEPGNPNVSYMGAASGGIWKTDDAGVTWRPVFDQTDDSSIGALAVAPSNPKQVWAGTGETFVIRPAHAYGNGVYKSSNAGKSWKNMGLEKTYRISRVIVHPTDTNTVYVGALGHAHGPQQERGVFKTTDGGKTWNKVLFVNEMTGCSDLSIDPVNPEIIYAAMWQVEIKTWKMNSGGPGSGIYRSKDGGKTWEPLRNGLESGPNHPVGKTSVDVAYSNPKIVYALIEDKEPRLYRSEDGGDSWKLMNQNHSMAQRAPYYTRVRVSTQDPNRVYTICVTMLMSKDGGKTFSNELSPYAAGGDNHDMWFDPKDANRIMVAHDGCLNMSFNYGRTWRNINLPIAQMYHVAVDDQVPYYVYGNRQDAWSYRGPSRSLAGRGIPLGMWHGVGGCESGFAQPDPFDNNIVWSQCYDGGLDIFNIRTMHSRDVRAWPEAGYGWAPADMKYRWHWNFPMVLSKHIQGKVWVGSQYVHETTNGGQSWKLVSPDLTTNDKSHQQSSGGMSIDNLMTWDGCTLYSMAESPIKEGVLWAGSNDGKLHVTTDGAKTWTDVSATIPDLPKWATIRDISPSNFNEATCYIAVDAHQQGDFGSYAYKTSDMGKTWRRLTIELPPSNSNFVNQIREDIERAGLIWLGTDNAIYFSLDDGATWSRLKTNLPPAPVYGIALQKNFKDLVVGTYGRGIYILDNVTPIREWSEEIAGKDAHLFSVRKSYRFQDQDGIKADRSYVNGQNPPDGVDLNYYLKQKSKDSVEVYVLNSKGETVRKMKGRNRAGVNRIWWDYRHDPYQMPKLRTKPRGKDWVNLDSAGSRNMFIYDLDIGPGQIPPMVPSGKYTIVLKVGSNEFKQDLEILKDPTTKGTSADITKQYELGVKLYHSISTTLQLIDEMETRRSQLLAMAQDPKKSKQSLALEEKLYQLESKLHDVHQTGARQDIFRNPAQILERLMALVKEGQIYSADFPPTDQQLEVYTQLETKLKEVEQEYKKIKNSPENVKLKLRD